MTQWNNRTSFEDLEPTFGCPVLSTERHTFHGYSTWRPVEGCVSKGYVSEDCV